MKKLSAKFTEVMKECRYIVKNGENTFHGYKYATSADVLEKVNASLVNHGICSIAVPSIIDISDVKNAKGNTEHLVTVKMDITLVDSESGESLSITGLGSGQDSGDKAVMKAQTAAIKYAYMMSLCIATGDDPEADVKTDENSNTVLKPVMSNVSRNTAPIAQKDVIKCADCGEVIKSNRVVQFSVSKYGKPLCMECQKQMQSIKTA